METLNRDLGSYISTHLANARDESIRYRAASGGVVTSLLIYMFDEKLIDAAVCVAAKKDEPSVSEAMILNNRSDALAVSGSRYAFVSIRPELERLINMEMRIALVGLPCEIQAIRKSIQQKWESNIKLCIGLFCGCALSSMATEFILKKLNLKPEDLRLFEYRAGRWPGNLRIETKDGRVFSFPRSTRSIYSILNLLFVEKACLNCNDLFNEYCDISVGDAWYNLPDNKGHSTVIIRTKPAKSIFYDAVGKGYIEQQQIRPEILYKSHGHLIKYKKHRSWLLNLIIHMVRFGWVGRFLKVLPLGLLLIASKLYHRKGENMSNILERILKEIRYYSPSKSRWTLKAVGAFWDSIYNYDEINKETASYSRRFTDSFKLCGLANNSYLLDICSRTGNGSIFFYKNRKISKVVCADVSEKFQDICHEKLLKEGIEHKLCLFDSYRLPFKDKEFDGILSFETIEHIPEPEMFLKELHRLLKDDGELILTTPNVFWEPIHWIYAILNIHHSEGPHKFISRKRLLSMISSSGFRVKKEKSCVLIPGGSKIGQKIESFLGEYIMRITALRRIFILKKALKKSKNTQGSLPDEYIIIII